MIDFKWPDEETTAGNNENDFAWPDEPQQPKKLPFGTAPMKTQEMLDKEAVDVDENDMEEDLFKRWLKKKMPKYEDLPSPNDFAHRLYQVAGGFIKSHPLSWGMDLAKVLGGADISDLNDILMKMPPEEQEEYEKKYMGASQQILENLPSQELGEQLADKYLGTRFQPEDQLDKSLRLGGLAYGAGTQMGGTTAQNATNASLSPVFSGLLQEMGVNEGIAEALALPGPHIARLGISAGKEGAKKGIEAVKKALPGTKAAQLEGQMIPANLPKLPLRTAEEALKELQLAHGAKSEIPTKIRVPGEKPPTKGYEEGFKQRFKVGGEPVEMTPNTPPKKIVSADDLNQRNASIFSKEKFKNPTEGGIGAVQEIRVLDDAAYAKVNDAYTLSRDLNKQIAETQPELLKKLNETIDHIDTIPHPSSIQENLRKTAKDIKSQLIAQDVEGVEKLVPINNQTLIDQIQSIRQIVDYDFEHGGAKGIFKPVLKELQDSVVRAGEKSGNTVATAANREARKLYRDWAEKFDNDYVRPFRDKSNFDYEKLYTSSQKTDNFNQVFDVLNESPRGKEILNGIKADAVENKFSSFSKDPAKMSIREFNQALRDVEALKGVTESQVNKIKQNFIEARQNINKPVKKVEAKIAEPSYTEKVASKYLEMKDAEVLQKKANTPLGIRDLKKDFLDPKRGRVEQGQKLYDTISKQNMRNRLYEGDITKKSTGSDIARVLKKEKNYEYFSEILGQKEVDEFIRVAEEIGKKEMRADAVSKYAKKALFIKSYKLLWPLIL